MHSTQAKINILPENPRQQQVTKPRISSAEEWSNSSFQTDSENRAITLSSAMDSCLYAKTNDACVASTLNQDNKSTTSVTNIPSSTNTETAHTTLSQGISATNTESHPFSPALSSTSSIVSPESSTHTRYFSRSKIEITLQEMAKYFYCPQALAAKKLGVSLSTLKRRFYLLGVGRWPYQYMTQDEKKRSVWHLVSEVEPSSEKELSTETIQTLTRLFSMSLREQQLLATQSPAQRNLSLNGNESRRVPTLKFLQYVPKSELSVSQNRSIPTSPSNLTIITEATHKRQRRHLLGEEGDTTSNEHPGESRKKLRLSGSSDDITTDTHSNMISPNPPKES